MNYKKAYKHCGTWDIVHVCEIYHENGVQHTAKLGDKNLRFMGELLCNTSNGKEIRYRKGIRGATVNLDDLRIISVTGYNTEDGLYCDTY